MIILPSDYDYEALFGEVAKSCVTGADGKIYSMPYAIKNYAIFYNKEILITPSTISAEWMDLGRIYGNGAGSYLW